MSKEPQTIDAMRRLLRRLPEGRKDEILLDVLWDAPGDGQSLEDARAVIDPGRPYDAEAGRMTVEYLRAEFFGGGRPG